MVHINHRNYENRFLFPIVFMAIVYGLSFVFMPDGVLLKLEYEAIVGIVFALFLISSIYWLWQGGDPKARTLNVKFYTIIGGLAMIMAAVGYGGGLLASRMSFGLLTKYTSGEYYQATFICVRAEKNRYRGWVNYFDDGHGNHYQLTGFNNLCGVGPARRNDMFSVSGKVNSFGIMITAISKL